VTPMGRGAYRDHSPSSAAFTAHTTIVSGVSTVSSDQGLGPTVA
jgi:hypothetical protein